MKMALEFTILNMEWNENSREYETEIILGESDMAYKYGITINGSNVYFNEWLSPKNRLSILDMNDCPFNGNKPHIHLCPYNESSREMITEAYCSIREFLRIKCREE